MSDGPRRHVKLRLLVVCGVPGAGKSTLAAALACATGLPVIDSRTARANVTAGLARADPCGYSASVYPELGRLAAIAAARHDAAIVDATFRRASDRQMFARGLGACPPDVLFLKCHARPEVLQERARRRASEGHPVDPDQRSFAPLTDIPPRRRLLLSTDRPTSHVVGVATRFLIERGYPTVRLRTARGRG